MCALRLHLLMKMNAGAQYAEFQEGRKIKRDATCTTRCLASVDGAGYFRPDLSASVGNVLKYRRFCLISHAPPKSEPAQSYILQSSLRAYWNDSTSGTKLQHKRRAATAKIARLGPLSTLEFARAGRHA